MEDGQGAPDEWKEILAEAYGADSLSRELMDKFNARFNELKRLDAPIDKDPEAIKLFSDLVLAVRAHLEGKQITVSCCNASIQ